MLLPNFKVDRSLHDYGVVMTVGRGTAAQENEVRFPWVPHFVPLAGENGDAIAGADLSHLILDLNAAPALEDIIYLLRFRVEMLVGTHAR